MLCTPFCPQHSLPSSSDALGPDEAVAAASSLSPNRRLPPAGVAREGLGPDDADGGGAASALSATAVPAPPPPTLVALLLPDARSGCC